MANQLLTPQMITREALPILKNKTVMLPLVNRKFENYFHEIGTTLPIRKPNRFMTTLGPALQLQNITEQSTPVTINLQRHVDTAFTAADLALSVGDFRDRYLLPAMETLAQMIDYDIMTNFVNVPYLVGTPGSVPNSYQTSIQLVRQKMTENGAPLSGRNLVLNPQTYGSISGGISNNFVTSTSKPALEEGVVHSLGGMPLYESANVQSQTTGVYGAVTPQVNLSGQSGSTVNLKGFVAGTSILNKGDVITIAGVFNINPQTRASTGQLQNFVVTATTTADGSGNMALPIFPALQTIATANAYATVNTLPLNNAAVTILSGASGGTYAQNIAFHPDAFGFVSVALPVPEGVHFAAAENFDGISLRIVRQYDINNDVIPCRIDVLYGTATYYPELACRLTA